MYLTSYYNSVTNDININVVNSGSNTNLFATSLTKAEAYSIINNNLEIEDKEPKISGGPGNTAIITDPVTNYTGTQFLMARADVNFNKPAREKFLLKDEIGSPYNNPLFTQELSILNNGTPWSYQHSINSYNRNFSSSEQTVNSSDCIEGFILGDSTYPSKFCFIKDYAFAFVFNPNIKLWKVYQSNKIDDDYSSFDANFSTFVCNLPAEINMKHIEPLVIGTKLIIFTSTLKAISCEILPSGLLANTWEAITFYNSITAPDSKFTIVMETGTNGILYFNHDIKKIYSIYLPQQTLYRNWNIADVTTKFLNINTLLTSTWNLVIPIGPNNIYIIDSLHQIVKCCAIQNDYKVFPIPNPINIKFSKKIEHYFLVNDAIFFICTTGEIFKCPVNVHNEIEFDSMIELTGQQLTINSIGNTIITSNSVYLISQSVNLDGKLLAKRFDFNGGSNDLINHSYYKGTVNKNPIVFDPGIIKLETTGELSFKFDSSIFSPNSHPVPLQYGFIFLNIITGETYSLFKNNKESISNFTSLKEIDGQGFVKVSPTMPPGYYSIYSYDCVFGEKIYNELGDSNYQPGSVVLAVADIVFSSGPYINESTIVEDVIKALVRALMNKCLVKSNIILST
jgi:hypothetical protein